MRCAKRALHVPEKSPTGTGNEPYTGGKAGKRVKGKRDGLTHEARSLVYNERDQPNGECYVELSSADEMTRALMLHRDSLGHRYVELFKSTRNEAMQVRGGRRRRGVKSKGESTRRGDAGVVSSSSFLARVQVRDS